MNLFVQTNALLPSGMTLTASAVSLPQEAKNVSAIIKEVAPIWFAKIIVDKQPKI
jgi:hypothetical protein